ncbi:mannonate dehydratase [Alsobacter sp. SYSU M60028]|uniref:mannonate dehydratase n=1 Tax=Alsobacter ponti TaxID=2962936 RepID=A0ABT1LIN4_9HYPH|nr:mannonate dehydratase [Alsobacter ponti]MCP8940083.1 mannonate dehydratase [Alsobacter ponti]
MTQQGIRIGVGQFNELTDEKLRFAKQIGASGIQMNTPKLPGDARWEEKDLRALVDKTREHGLVLEAIENVPTHFYHKAMLGLPGRDEQIENYRATVRNVGRAGIPILGFHFMPNSVWRTERFAPGRGGAGCTKFDMAEVEAKASKDEWRQYLPTSLGWQETMPLRGKDEAVVTEEEMWANYTYFIKAVLPVAEEAGVKLALHPDDPPVPMLGGVARLFYKPENFIRAWEINPNSDAWGLDLCLGCCSEMPGGAANVRRMIEFFGPKGRIFYVHFRDVQGTVPNFQECFIGEGNFDPAEVMFLLQRNGFKGFLLDDHVPHMDDDTEWNHRGRAHAIGYMQGLLRMGELRAA